MMPYQHPRDPSYYSTTLKLLRRKLPSWHNGLRTIFQQLDAFSREAVFINGGQDPHDVLYCPFPLFHADSTALTVIPAILLGAVAALSVRFSASRFWDEIRASKATIYDFTGATLALTYKQPPTGQDRNHNVRLAWGVPIPRFAGYKKRFGRELVTLYGSVEASLPILQEPGTALPLRSCGRVRNGYQLRVADDMDEELPPNAAGNLLLRSDNPNAFFQGYFNDFASTAVALKGLWLHTGDTAEVDEGGNVYFLGHVKDVIRRRGENINASDLEEEFLQHPDVITAAAYGIPSQLGSGTDEDVKVAVQIRSGSQVDEKGTLGMGGPAHGTVSNPISHRIRERSEEDTNRQNRQTRAEHWLGGRRFDIRRGSTR